MRREIVTKEIQTILEDANQYHAYNVKDSIESLLRDCWINFETVSREEEDEYGFRVEVKIFIPFIPAIVEIETRKPERGANARITEASIKEMDYSRFIIEYAEEKGINILEAAAEFSIDPVKDVISTLEKIENEKGEKEMRKVLLKTVELPDTVKSVEELKEKVKIDELFELIPYGDKITVFVREKLVAMYEKDEEEEFVLTINGPY